MIRTVAVVVNMVQEDAGIGLGDEVEGLEVEDENEGLKVDDAGLEAEDETLEEEDEDLHEDEDEGFDCPARGRAVEASFSCCQAENGYKTGMV